MLIRLRCSPSGTQQSAYIVIARGNVAHVVNTMYALSRLGHAPGESAAGVATKWAADGGRVAFADCQSVSFLVSDQLVMNQSTAVLRGCTNCWPLMWHHLRAQSRTSDMPHGQLSALKLGK